MVRKACCSDLGLNKGPWTPHEDLLLKNYVQTHGEGRWSIVPQKTGLVRCGRSCRLRWMNYLRPDVKHDNISADEEELIIRLHELLGNRWALIAARMPGRTDNQIKNAWYSRLRKKLNKTRVGSKPPSSTESILTAANDEIISHGTKNYENGYCEEMKQSIARFVPEWPSVGSSENKVYCASNPEMHSNGIDITLQNAINWYNVHPFFFDPASKVDQVYQESSHPSPSPSPFLMNNSCYWALMESQ
ncbi:hypothetical protein KI387_024929, partial [Taxus chinensis]